jgi:ketosteroid isomerase-like protein
LRPNSRHFLLGFSKTWSPRLYQTSTLAAMSIRNSVERLIQYVGAGDYLTAIETFYAPDATMQENNQAPRVGLPALLENERRMMQNFKQIHQSAAISYIVDGDRVAINWVFDITLQDGSRFPLDEIAYQQWRNDKIVQERFFYDPAQVQAVRQP